MLLLLLVILADAGGGGLHLRLLQRPYIRVAMHTCDADDAECGMRRVTGPYTVAGVNYPAESGGGAERMFLISLFVNPNCRPCVPIVFGKLWKRK